MKGSNNNNVKGNNSSSTNGSSNNNVKGRKKIKKKKNGAQVWALYKLVVQYIGFEATMFWVAATLNLQIGVFLLKPNYLTW